VGIMAPQGLASTTALANAGRLRDNTLWRRRGISRPFLCKNGTADFMSDLSTVT
jgi:hypothetical protein